MQSFRHTPTTTHQRGFRSAGGGPSVFPQRGMGHEQITLSALLRLDGPPYALRNLCRNCVGTVGAVVETVVETVAKYIETVSL